MKTEKSCNNCVIRSSCDTFGGVCCDYVSQEEIERNSLRMNILQLEAELEDEAKLITEAIGDIITIISMNDEKTAIELIRKQFVVIDKQDI